jgi:hypothetical protein
MKKNLILCLVSLLTISCFNNIEKRENLTVEKETIKLNSDSPMPNEPDKKISEQKPGTGSEAAFNNQDKLQRVDFAGLAPENQKFSIDPQTDNIISCKSGTRFMIPAYSFPGRSKVDIKIREYHSKTAAYINNLTTVTTDGKILESGGMFNIEATVNGMCTNLNQGAEIYIEAASELSSDMGIFYGKNDSDGNVLWDFDPTGTSPSPVIVTVRGPMSKQAKEVLAKSCKFEKGSMIKMIGNSWTSSLSFDSDGSVIGNSLCTESDPVRQEACMAMLETIKKIDKKHFASSFRRTSVDVVFTCKSMEEYLFEKNKETSLSEMDKALSGFSSSKLGRKYFAIRRLGNINIDRFIPIPELTERSDVMVKASSGKAENCKLVFSNNKTLMNAIFNNGYFVFKDLPIGTEYKVLSTVADKDAIYIASSSGTVQKKNEHELSFVKIDEKDLSSKIAEICN